MRKLMIDEQVMERHAELAVEYQKINKGSLANGFDFVRERVKKGTGVDITQRMHTTAAANALQFMKNMRIVKARLAS